MSLTKRFPRMRHDAPLAVDGSHGGSTDLRSFVFDTVLEGMRTSIYVTDPKTDRILYMNGFMKHDYGVEDPEGKVCWQVLQRGLTERCAFCPVDELLSCGDEVPLVEWDEESPMTGRTYRNYDSLVTWVDGSRVHLQQSVDITALVSANTDELTGMLSRRAGKERLGISLARAAVEGEQVSVVLYDINRLKDVNDLHGHAEGDYLIRSAANAVRCEFGPNDYGFRLSGDEFVCVFLGDAASTRVKIERARAALSATPRRTEPPYEMGFCFGIAEADPEAPLELYEVLALADRRMYEEKRRFHIDRNINALISAERSGRGVSVDPCSFSYDEKQAVRRAGREHRRLSVRMQHENRRVPLPARYGGRVRPSLRGGGKNAAAVWGSKVHPDDKQAFLESNQEVADARTTRHWVEYRAINRKGEWVRLRCRGRLILDAKGKPLLFAGFIVSLLVSQIFTILIYSFCNGSRKRSAAVKRLLYAVVLLVLAYVAMTVYEKGFSMETVCAAVTDPYLQWVPIIGWMTGGIFSAIRGFDMLGAVYFALLAAAALIALLAFLKSDSDYYEDVLQNTETTYEVQKGGQGRQYQYEPAGTKDPEGKDRRHRPRMGRQRLFLQAGKGKCTAILPWYSRGGSSHYAGCGGRLYFHCDDELRGRRRTYVLQPDYDGRYHHVYLRAGFSSTRPAPGARK